MAHKGRDKPTIQDIADTLGISRATVSRAFSRPDLVAESTTTRVHEIAGQLGYVANPVARGLSTGRYGNIAIIVPDIANPFFPPVIRAMQRRADEQGFGVFIGDTDGDPARELAIALRLAPQIEGFVLASSRMPEPDIRRVADARPTVMINRDVRTLSRVLIDPTQGLDAAVHALAGLGHRHLAYIAGPASSWSDQQRRNVLRSAAKRHGISIKVIEGYTDSFEGGRHAAGVVLGAGFTGAIAFDDSVAHGLLAGLAEAERAVPRSFSLVGFDDVLGASTYPPLSSVHAPGEEAGRRAVELLMDEIDRGGPSDPPVCERLATVFVTRATTGPAGSGPA